MKKEKLEFYTVKPNLKQIYGKRITKDTSFDEWTEDKTVHQILKDCKLTTFIENEYETQGVKVKETSKTEVVYPEGTVLIWNEKIGYILPQVQVCTLDEIKQDIEDINGIYTEIKGE